MIFVAACYNTPMRILAKLSGTLMLLYLLAGIVFTVGSIVHSREPGWAVFYAPITFFREPLLAIVHHPVSSGAVILLSYVLISLIFDTHTRLGGLPLTLQYVLRRVIVAFPFAYLSAAVFLYLRTMYFVDTPEDLQLLLYGSWMVLVEPGFLLFKEPISSMLFAVPWMICWVILVLLLWPLPQHVRKQMELC